ncbi:MAG: hypothetical protein V3T22_14285 [Planctomycetota bacterium]
MMDAVAVQDVAVVTGLLAVIRDDHDDRVLQPVHLLEHQAL